MIEEQKDLAYEERLERAGGVQTGEEKAEKDLISVCKDVMEVKR